MVGASFLKRMNDKAKTMIATKTPANIYQRCFVGRKPSFLQTFLVEILVGRKLGFRPEKSCVSEQPLVLACFKSIILGIHFSLGGSCASDQRRPLDRYVVRKLSFRTTVDFRTTVVFQRLSQVGSSEFRRSEAQLPPNGFLLSNDCRRSEAKLPPNIFCFLLTE